MLVLLVHATENLYVMDAVHLNAMSVQSRIFAIICFTLGRLGVPLFLFLSGYLLLDRSYTELSIHKFGKKNWLGMLVTTEVWIILYDIFLRAFHFQHWSTWGLLRDMLLTNQVHMAHMWYMPMIIGVYVCIPFAARALQGISLRVVFFPLVLFSAYAFGVPVWKSIFPKSPALVLIDLGFAGGVYGLYLLWGWRVKKGLFKNIHARTIGGCTVALFLLVLGIELASYARGIAYNVWYNNAFLAGSALLLFSLFVRIKNGLDYSALCWLSRNSFGIYLLHFPALMLIRKILLFLPWMMPTKVMILWLAVLFISCVLCWIIDHFPRLARILLYNR